MTSHLFANPAQTQSTQTGSDGCAPDCQENVISDSQRDHIKSQTGSVLIALGAMFSQSPVFREHIDNTTADMLVSLGKKLKRK